jgi:hypothetical protein
MLRGIALVMAFVLLPTVLAEEPRRPTHYEVEVTVRKGLVLGTGPTRTIRLRIVAKNRFILVPARDMQDVWFQLNDRCFRVLLELEEKVQGNAQLRFLVEEITAHWDGELFLKYTTRTSASAPVSLTDPIRVETTLEGTPLWIEVRMREGK